MEKTSRTFFYHALSLQKNHWNWLDKIREMRGRELDQFEQCTIDAFVTDGGVTNTGSDDGKKGEGVMKKIGEGAGGQLWVVKIKDGVDFFEPKM